MFELLMDIFYLIGAMAVLALVETCLEHRQSIQKSKH